MRHVISILLQNESGALARVATMFASRGFNIESLNVAPTQDEVVSRLTLTTSADDDKIGQINKQLAKLVDVVAIADRTTTDHIERELCLLKLRVEPERIEEARERVARSSGSVLDEAPDHFTVELAGSESDLDGFVVAMEEVGEVLSVVRSGTLAISRGSKSLGEDVEELQGV